MTVGGLNAGCAYACMLAFHARVQAVVCHQRIALRGTPLASHCQTCKCRGTWSSWGRSSREEFPVSVDRGADLGGGVFGTSTGAGDADLVADLDVSATVFLSLSLSFSSACARIAACCAACFCAASFCAAACCTPCSSNSQPTHLMSCYYQTFSECINFKILS